VGKGKLDPLAAQLNHIEFALHLQYFARRLPTRLPVPILEVDASEVALACLSRISTQSREIGPQNKPANRACRMALSDPREC
jgi:hypothetical protein